MSNALRYTFEGGVRLTVEPDKPNPNLLRFVISDSGIGMDSAMVKNLFIENKKSIGLYTTKTLIR